ncbi:unnamed protein product [Adineta steineri]|uniref:Uncharacterized protein n=1 Tax=Adineta steineri TaxID=433720 RepID=A0A818Z2C8_9BILA|nr:unnamed protein product [Adineta steineri]CAF3762649.1 unnamed protein product [Adineta steineri]
MNSTISILPHNHHHSIESIQHPTAINELAPSHYDTAGAAIFIVVVLSWYAIGIVCMLGMQIRARADTIEECARRRTKLFIQTLRDQTQTKEILEELVDKQKRDKLWDIYLGKTTNDKLRRADTRRIRNIKKQLAVINRDRIYMNDTIVTPVVNNFIRRTSDPQAIMIPNLSLIENQPRIRRRSSLDLQIIERWKSLANQSKTHEQLPWSIRKLLISRHFRRYGKRVPDRSEQINKPATDLSLNQRHVGCIDDEQRYLLPFDKRVNNNNNNLHRITEETNDRLNPYTTYFHLPINENVQFNMQNIPLVTINSDHSIIQLCSNESQC